MSVFARLYSKNEYSHWQITQVFELVEEVQSSDGASQKECLGEKTGQILRRSRKRRGRPRGTIQVCNWCLSCLSGTGRKKCQVGKIGQIPPTMDVRRRIHKVCISQLCCGNV